MEQVKVLFGFDAPKFEKGVICALKQRGFEVETTAKYTKSSIRDFLIANPSYKTAVLLEVMNNSADRNAAKYTAEELAMLTDERDINIIVLLNDSHRGTRFMEILYTAGITSAIYQKGRKGGATPKDVVELIINKRNNRQAREYYGIADAPISLGFLGNDTFAEYYGHLTDMQYGNTLIERFVNVCAMMNQKQIADFIRRTPEEVLEELKNYEEFYTVLEMIRGNGIDLKIKRSKKTKIGLSTPENMDAVRRQIVQETESGLLYKRKEKKSMSFEELLANMCGDEEKGEIKRKEADDILSEYDGLKDVTASISNCMDADKRECLENIYTGSESKVDTLNVSAIKSRSKQKRQKEELPSVEDFINEKKKVHAGSYIAIGAGIISMLLVVVGTVIIIL